MMTIMMIILTITAAAAAATTITTTIETLLFLLHGFYRFLGVERVAILPTLNKRTNAPCALTLIKI
jgi:hypothetical protein